MSMRCLANREYRAILLKALAKLPYVMRGHGFAGSAFSRVIFPAGRVQPPFVHPKSGSPQ
jgi:hypothetical protein